MTTYTAVKEMLEVLDANPELMEALRARILTREILELPGMVAELSASQVRLENTLREFMGASREFMETASARLDSLEGAVVVIQRDVSYLKGKHMEMEIQRRIHGILGGQGLRRTRVVRAAYPSIALPAFCDAVSDAAGDGRIAGDDYDRVMDTDLIARAHRRGFDWDVYVAVEASNRLDRGDVDRVERTRRILAAVFPNSEIRAMVYGAEISDADRRRAESKGVETLLERRY